MKILILSSHRALGQCLGRSLSKCGRRDVRHLTKIEQVESHLHELKTVLLADLRYPVAKLDTLLARREKCGSPMKVLLLGLAADDPDALGLLEWNIEGSLPMDAGLSDIAEALDHIEDGETFYPPGVAFLLFELLAEKAREQELRQRLEALTLTRRELEVLQLLGRRQSNDAIAVQLGISIHTVKNHVHKILGKLKVDNRASAVDLASRRGWLRGYDVA